MASSRIVEFLRDLDRGYASLGGVARVRLDVIGGSAILLGTEYARHTEDVDVLEAWADPEVGPQLDSLAGPKSRLQSKHRLYLERVPPGLPFLPRLPVWRPVAFQDELYQLEVRLLDVVDIAVSKLKRFNSRDRDDVDWLVANEFVSLAAFRSRFHLAIDEASASAQAETLDRTISNFNEVERDFFAASETRVELPDWVR